MVDITNRFKWRELIAIGVSATIVLAALCYWIVQIEGVRAMLKLAEG